MNAFYIILGVSRRDCLQNYPTNKDSLGDNKLKIFVTSISDLKDVLSQSNKFIIIRTDSYRQSEFYEDAERLLDKYNLSELPKAKLSIKFVTVHDLIIPCLSWDVISDTDHSPALWPKHVPTELSTLVGILRLDMHIVELFCCNVNIRKKYLCIQPPIIVENIEKAELK